MNRNLIARESIAPGVYFWGIWQFSVFRFRVNKVRLHDVTIFAWATLASDAQPQAGIHPFTEHDMFADEVSAIHEMKAMAERVIRCADRRLDELSAASATEGGPP